MEEEIGGVIIEVLYLITDRIGARGSKRGCNLEPGEW